MNSNLLTTWGEDQNNYPHVRDSRQDVTAVTDRQQLQAAGSQCRLADLDYHQQGCGCGAGNTDLINKYNDMNLSHLQGAADENSSLLPGDNGSASWWPQRQSSSAYPQAQYSPFSTSDNLPLQRSGSHTSPGAQLHLTAGSSLSDHIDNYGQGFGAPINYADPYSIHSPLSMGETSLTTYHRDAKHSAIIRHSPDSDRSISDGTTTPSSPNGLHHASSADYTPHRGSTEKQMNFPEMKTIYELKSKGKSVVPEIQAQMDKNLMWVDGQWTCYRRNYITINVHYWLKPNTPGDCLTVNLGDRRGNRTVQALGVSLSATMDSATGKSIGLVQHTAKRDRGPQTDVGIHKLPPLSPGCHMAPYHGSYNCETNGPELPMQRDNDGKNVSPSMMGQHTFERIQFKQATANNGRRRAQQQFYHIMIELYADVRERSSDKEDWVKIAHKVSEAMVVRGRSPGHYKDAPNSSGQSSGNGGSSSGGPRFPYPSHAGYGSQGALTSSQSRSGGYGGANGSYRANQCFSGSQGSVVNTPGRSFTSPFRRFHEPPALPLLSDFGAYTPVSTDDPSRYYANLPYEPGMRGPPQSMMKHEATRSPNPMISGSCGSEEPSFAPIRSPSWTLTTCNRIPFEAKPGYDLSSTF